MQPRRSLRLVAGALVLALPLLSSCGFNKATDKVYTPGEGTNNRDGDVKILAAVVVAAQPDSGTFLASLSNNSSEDSNALTELAGAGDSADLSIGAIDSPIEIPPRGFVNLADEGGVNVSGDFGAGDVVELTLTFDSGDSVTMDVPVVYACDEYAGLDSSAEASAEATDGATPSPSESESESASPAPTQPLYDCAAALSEG
jgi:copper(I)-binding protein